MIWCQKSLHFLLFQLLNVIGNVLLVLCGIEPQANRTTANPVGVLFQLVRTTLTCLKIRLKIIFGPTPQDKLLSSNASVFAYDILLRVSRNQAHELDIREGLRVSTAFQNGADATKMSLDSVGFLSPTSMMQTSHGFSFRTCPNMLYFQSSTSYVFFFLNSDTTITSWPLMVTCSVFFFVFCKAWATNQPHHVLPVPGHPTKETKRLASS